MSSHQSPLGRSANTPRTSQKAVVIYTEDLTGKEPEVANTRTFDLDGVQHEFDLAPEPIDQLLDALTLFMDKGRCLWQLR